MIERVAGVPFFEYLRERVFGLAGMDDTGPYSHDQDVPRLAYAHTRSGPSGENDSEPRWNNVYQHWTMSTPAGCEYSTVDDLFRFATALQTGVLLPPTSVETVLRGKVETGRRPGEHYAYGFFTEEVGGVQVVGHGGTVSG